MVDAPHYTRKQYAKRICMLIISLSIMACGTAMSKKAVLGTTPISCIPAVLSGSWSTIGMWTIVFNALLVAMQIAVLGRSFQKFQILQVLMGVGIGVFTDIWMEVFTFIDPSQYYEQWMWCLLSCVVLGFGIFMEVQSNVLTAPAEGLVLAFVTRFHVSFSKTKIAGDFSMVVIGVVLSLLTLGILDGVREGTIFASFAVGPIVGFFSKHCSSTFDRLVE